MMSLIKRQKLENTVSNVRAKHVAVNILNVIETTFGYNRVPKYAFRYAIGILKEEELMKMIKDISTTSIVQSVEKYVGDIGDYLINDEDCYGDEQPNLLGKCENFTIEECQLKEIPFDCLSKKTRSFNNLRHLKHYFDRCIQELDWCGNGLRSVRQYNDFELDIVLGTIDDTIESLMVCVDHICNLLKSFGQSLVDDSIEFPSLQNSNSTLSAPNTSR